MMTVEQITLAVAIIGAIGGTVGTVLGIVNTVHSLSQSKVRLKVTPECILKTERVVARTSGEMVDGGTLAINLINLSTFRVKIVDMGFSIQRKHRLAVDAVLVDGTRLPSVLEPRESLTAVVPPSLLWSPEITHVRRAYVQTACGEKRYGKSPALTEYVRAARTVRRGSEV